MASKNKDLIDIKELGDSVRRRRLDLKMSLRQVADETGISASTLSRIENGTGKPEAENIAALSAWLNIPIERVLKVDGDSDQPPVVYYPQESTPDIVAAHLRADKKLPKPSAEALAELFRVAYQQFLNSSQENKEKDG
ncbi:MAG TPA: helix-turn-helix domain-containing protein [Pyrinomonadaceae bacterium]|jgi:transcriptional regulator with XRE-family HTH domain|nr:helix-turn-helix domain-containing protein [Pyrinomonadaceae bacterium]